MAEDFRLRGSAFAVYSDDGGRSWNLGEDAAPATGESQIAELSDGRLMINMRSWRGKSRRAVAYSDDGGHSWFDLRDDPALIEPICQASLLRHSWPGEDRPGVLLFSNPAHRSRRCNLTVRASFDDGLTWSSSLLLNSGFSAYSCLERMSDGSAGCLYEAGLSEENETQLLDSKYARIVFQRIASEHLLDS
jgi:sialidase-1